VKFLEFIKIILRIPVHYNQRLPVRGKFFQMMEILLISHGSRGLMEAAAAIPPGYNPPFPYPDAGSPGPAPGLCL
jgi:hypothetical protein